MDRGHAVSAIDELLISRQPIHLGGMADPFIPAEEGLGVTRETLRILSQHDYPTVISTKGVSLVDNGTLETLRAGRFFVAVSMTSISAPTTRIIEPGVPDPDRLLEGLRRLSEAGVPTACRIQPLIPGRESDAEELIDACGEMGVRHISVEHLKLPIEAGWDGGDRLRAAYGVDYVDHYRRQGARRVGREWILPLRDRLPALIRLRRRTHFRGMTFGAADNDLLPLSDGGCCCSGADLLEGFGGYHRYTYTEAVRRALSQAGRVSIDLLDDVATPSRSVRMHVNSRPRAKAGPEASGIKDFVRANWNGAANGFSPGSLFGVEPTGTVDDHGFAIYKVADELVQLQAAD